jgi:large subunit ribosomal protein L31e
VDTNLNQHIWKDGIRNVPRKVRIRLYRKPNEEEDAKEKFFTLIKHVEVDSFKGLSTELAKS